MDFMLLLLSQCGGRMWLIWDAIPLMGAVWKAVPRQVVAHHCLGCAAEAAHPFLEEVGADVFTSPAQPFSLLSAQS